VDGVYVNIGQRYSIIVTANQTAGNYAMRSSVVQTCFYPFNSYYSNGLNSTNNQVTGILSYDGIDVNAAPIGVDSKTKNPSGAATNQFNNLVYEGCDDLPFDVAVPMRKEAAYEVSPANEHYMTWTFNQIDDVDRIIVNKVGSACSPLCYIESRLVTNLQANAYTFGPPDILGSSASQRNLFPSIGCRLFNHSSV
jgi:hypothetical protein